MMHRPRARKSRPAPGDHAMDCCRPLGVWRVLLGAVSLLVVGCAGGVVPCGVTVPQFKDRPVLESASVQERTDDAGALELRIEAGDAAPSRNSIRVRLRNISSQSLWVNARMFAESSLGEVSLEVAPSSAGKPWSDGCQVHPGPVQYVLLLPGSEISVVTVLHCLKFPTEGPWRLTAKYEDRKRHIPPVPPGASWFSGALVSNELEFHAWPSNPPLAP